MNLRQIDMVRSDCAEKSDQYVASLAPLKNSHIFMTGGTGFMGSWIAEMVSFLNDVHGFNISLSLLSRSKSKFLKAFKHLATKSYINLIEKNVCDLTEIPSDVSYVIHAAGIPDNRLHSSNPLAVVQGIVNGTNQVLDAAARLSNLKRVINISSGLVYGAQPSSIEAFSENYIGGPTILESGTATYAEAKRMGESICSIYRDQFRLPICTLRPFAFIGPYQPITGPWAINNFFNDVLKGAAIKILGNPDTRRSYLYASDMAVWILKALSFADTGAVYNLGSDHSISLRDVAEKIAGKTANKSSVSIIGSGKKAISFIPNIDKIKTELDLEITVSLDSALERTLNFLKIED